MPKLLESFGRSRRLAIHFFAFSVAIIFLVEFIIMQFILPYFLKDLSIFWIAMVDSVTLIALLLPMLYMVVLGPLNRLSTEQRIAEEVQKIILGVPDNPTGLNFGYAYQSATIEEAKLGGDFFDLFELADEKIAIVIGDVSGKGLEAAKVANSTKLTIKAYAHQKVSPGKVMSLTNDLIARSSEDSTFVTAFFCIFDPATSRLQFCNAGHTDSYIKRSTSSTIEVLETRSLPLGVSLDHEFLEGEAQLEAGDNLILYTDGVTDARRDGKLFGEERLIGMLSRDNQDPIKMPDLILQELLSFSSGVLADDLAILVVSPDVKTAIKNF